MEQISVFKIIKGDNYIILPTKNKPKWIISLKNKNIYQKSFEFYQPNRWTGYLLKFLLKNSYLIQKYFNKNKVDIINLFQFIDSEDASVSLGTLSKEQKPTIIIFKHNEIFAYAKIGHNTMTRKFVKNEYNTLQELNLKKLSFLIPHVISYKEDMVFNILTQSTLPGLRPIKPKITSDIIKLALEIEALADSKELVFCHGDFSPWNIKYSKNENKYFVFDWEKAKTIKKLKYSYDIYYFIYIFLKCIKLTSSKKIKELLINLYYKQRL